jgi:DNA-binding NtrC family response regulator
LLPLLAGRYAAVGSSEPPSSQRSEVIRVLLVADDVALRETARTELSPGFELLPVNTFALAEPLLELDPPPAVILIDLGLADAANAAEFLASLVERDYSGPRLLLSGRFRRQEASTLSQSSILHFALPAPWAEGQLRATVEAALGFRPFPSTLHTL